VQKLSAKECARKARTLKLIRVLKKLYPDAGMALRYGSDWELLVAVMLSAQCTDKKVNEVTVRLFKKYRTLDEYVRANRRAFERDIHSTGFYRNKTKNILAAARMVRDEFGGKVPKTIAEMLRIPGVARKTANVVLGNAHGVVDGIAVDTHVRRFALKFDLSDYRDPVRIERDLMRILPKRDWFRFTYLVIEYGRNVCPGRVHDCAAHPLSKIYPPAAKHFPKAHS
jgi:endonuclease-3